jgi:hypothetical protein
MIDLGCTTATERTRILVSQKDRGSLFLGQLSFRARVPAAVQHYQLNADCFNYVFRARLGHQHGTCAHIA